MNPTTLVPDTTLAASDLERGDAFALTGDRYKVLATSAETSGVFCALEVVVTPGGGPPPHVHANEDEAFYVIDGELEVTVAGKLHVLRAGELAFGPRNIPHNFRNATNRPVRLLIQVFPGSSARFFAEVARPLPADGAAVPPPDESEIRHLLATAPRHGITLLPPA